MSRMVRLCIATLLIAAAPLISMAAVPNYQGLWYNAPAESESGWGINLAHQGDVIFATWFTYDAAGKRWWLTMTANKAAEGVYSGELIRTNGTPFSNFVAPATATIVGAGTLTFTSATTGTFSYTVNDGANVATQTKSIVLQTFGSVPACVWGAQPDLRLANNYQDLWWAAGGTESGWGVNLTHQGTTIFATWFTYDANRNPLWLSATLAQSGPGTYTGMILLTGGQAFNATPFNPTKITRTTVGSATLTFSNGNAGTFSYAVDLGDGVNSATQNKAIARQVFREPGTICAEASGLATAEGIWRGTTNQGQAVTIVILDDGTFYIVFSGQGTTIEAGVLHGSSSSVNGVFNATDVKEYPMSPSSPPFIGGTPTVHGTYVPRTTLQLNFGLSSVTASYDPTYDQPGNLASLAGVYQGFVGHVTEQAAAMSVMDNQGNLTIYGVQCTTVVSATPRGTVNLFNVSVNSPTCYNGPGILFYDSARRKLYALSAFYNGLLGFLDMWYAIGTRP